MGNYTAANTYEVTHKPSEQHSNVDSLLRLPLEFDTDWTDETEDTVCLLEQQQLNQLPIKASDFRQATAKDPVLSKVYNFTMQGWPISIRSLPSNLKPFYKHQFNLNTFNGFLLLCLRVVILKSTIHLC